jgi:hypothetical protein
MKNTALDKPSGYHALRVGKTSVFFTEQRTLAPLSTNTKISNEHGLRISRTTLMKDKDYFDDLADTKVVELTIAEALLCGKHGVANTYWNWRANNWIDYHKQELERLEAVK